MPSPVHLLLFAISILLQLSVAPLFSIKDITPDFILIVVVAIALQRGRMWGIIVACLAGLLFDVFGSGFVGLSSLAKTITAFLAGFIGGERLERRFLSIVGFLFLLLLVHDSLYFTILSIGTSIGFWSTILRFALPTTVYTLTFMTMINLVWPRLLWGRAGS
jgi:rod shape-determining protein MreD